MFISRNPSNMKILLLFLLQACAIFTTVKAQLQNREGVTIPTLEINLYARAMNGSMFLADGILQNFNTNFSAAVDNMDVRKFMNATDNLAIKNGAYNLIVERRPNICTADTLQLMLTGTRIAPYRFEIDPSVLNCPAVKAFLVDKFLRTETSVSLTSVTSISFDITNDPLSRVANRFMIVYRQQDPVRFTSVMAERNTDNSIKMIFNTENENNVNNYSIERSTDGIAFEPIATQMPTANNFGNPYYNYYDGNANDAFNWYRVKANTITGAVIYSIAAKAGAAYKKQKGNIYVYPNPITNGVINIGFQNKPLGLYKLSIVSSTGQTVYSETLSMQSAVFNKSIKIAGLSSSIYRLIAEEINGQKTILTLVVE